MLSPQRFITSRGGGWRHRPPRTAAARLLLVVVVVVLFVVPRAQAAAAFTELLDAATGAVRTVPDGEAAAIAAVVTSPGTESAAGVPADVLLAAAAPDVGGGGETTTALVACRGATLGGLGGADDPTVIACLAACGRVADCLLVDGVTVGDAEAGLRHTRHARTLSALFRGRLLSPKPNAGEEDPSGSGENDEKRRQALLLAVSGDGDDLSQAGSLLEQDAEALYDAIAVERGEEAGSFADLYDLRVVSADSKVLLCRPRRYHCLCEVVRV